MSWSSLFCTCVPQLIFSLARFNGEVAWTCNINDDIKSVFFILACLYIYIYPPVSFSSVLGQYPFPIWYLRLNVTFSFDGGKRSIFYNQSISLWLRLFARLMRWIRNNLFVRSQSYVGIIEDNISRYWMITTFLPDSSMCGAHLNAPTRLDIFFLISLHECCHWFRNNSGLTCLP